MEIDVLLICWESCRDSESLNETRIGRRSCTVLSMGKGFADILIIYLEMRSIHYFLQFNSMLALPPTSIVRVLECSRVVCVVGSAPFFLCEINADICWSC